MNVTILKIGGHLINDAAALAATLQRFAEMPSPKILVHGGGRRASELSKTLGISPQLVEGRRITDAATLEIVTMVYAGLLNKQIVAALQALDCNALGLSGADLNAIQSKRRGAGAIDYGFVGDVETCNAEMLKALLQLNIAPVFCAITHDKKGQLLNTNADTIAATLAVALADFAAVTLQYSFEKRGVLYDIQDENSLIEQMTVADYARLRAENRIFEGMIPKIDNAFAALRKGVHRVQIGETVFLEG